MHICKLLQQIYFYFYWGQHKIAQHLFGQFTDYNSGRKHGSWTNDPNLFIYFFRSVYNIHFLFENSQNSFWCGSPFGPFWTAKYPIQTTHHTFQESRHLRLLKIHIIFCSPSGAKKRYQLMDYNASSKFFL